MRIKSQRRLIDSRSFRGLRGVGNDWAQGLALVGDLKMLVDAKWRRLEEYANKRLRKLE